MGIKLSMYQHLSGKKMLRFCNYPKKNSMSWGEIERNTDILKVWKTHTLVMVQKTKFY